MEAADTGPDLDGDQAGRGWTMQFSPPKEAPRSKAVEGGASGGATVLRVQQFAEVSCAISDPSGVLAPQV